MGPAGAGEFLEQPGRARLGSLEPEDVAARGQPANGVQLLERPRQFGPAVLPATLGLGWPGGQELEPRPLVVHRLGFLPVGHAADGQQQSGGAVVAARLRRSQPVEQERRVRDGGQGVLLQKHRPGPVAGQRGPWDATEGAVRD